MGPLYSATFDTFIIEPDLIYNGGPTGEFGNGSSSDDELYGGGGNDTLRGFAGNDTLDGGTGADWLEGGLDNDLYIIRKGDGADTFGLTELINENVGEGTDTILLEGITASDVTFSSFGSNYVILSIDDGTGTLFHTAINAIGDIWSRIERIEFGDGTFLDATTGFTHTGTSGTDTFLGGSTSDTLIGLAGDDTLYGVGGADLLNGGAGSDRVTGGDGDDTYLLGRGDGALLGEPIEYFVEYAGQGTDTLRIVGVLPEDLLFYTVQGNIYTLGIHDATNTLRFTTLIGNFSTTDLWSSYERIEFDDGTVWTVSTGAVFRGADTNDFVGGTINHDSILGEDGEDTLSGYAGDDTLFGGEANDALYGGANNDTLNGGAGADTLYGNAGDDTYLISAGDSGAQNTDFIVEVNNQGFDTLHFTGIDATDLIINYSRFTRTTVEFEYWHFGVDNGGGTILWTSVENYYGNFWDIYEAVTFDDGTTYTALTGLTQYGQGTADAMWATDAGDDLYGGGGDDDLQGDIGNDLFVGGLGADYMWGRGGDDTYRIGLGEGGAAQGTEFVRDDFNAGFDTINFTGVTIANTSIVYGAGQFHFGLGDGTGNTTWVSVGVGLGNGWTTFWQMFEQITFDDGTIWTSANVPNPNGTNNDDVLEAFITGSSLDGFAGNDTITGNDGADALFGGSGNDTLFGGDADDTISGGADADLMVGGDGSDTFLIGIGDGAAHPFDDRIVEFSGNSGTDILHFTDGLTIYDIAISLEENLIGFGIDDGTGTTLWTSAFNVSGTTFGIDALWSVIEEIRFDDGTVLDENTIAITNGTTGDDTLTGSVFKDDIYGGDGNDTLSGGSGIDYLYGGDDADVLIDDHGYDVMTGGAGADVFVFSNPLDGGRITDFEAGIDRIDLSAYVGADDAVLLRTLDGNIGGGPNPISNGDRGTLEITFLLQGSDLGINFTHTTGITLGSVNTFSFNITIDNGLSLELSTDLFLF